MIIKQKDIDALRDKLKIGDKVKYQTEVIDDRPGWVQKKQKRQSKKRNTGKARPMK